ncbi:Bgt-50976 [Blumeria graminis f. sp. tritici]|uniref:Bgt-50976 n=1 Tax=Blumeria graminis f. sp. tritici TaxID=62690 RepID=A0A9X9PRV6_BLUGR|nr:Bgt-50976 [Blumeria graminis f. sp. tritici]
MEKYLAQHPWERILKIFRTLYYSYFTTPCDTVFALPNDSETHLDPVRYLIENFTIYIRRAPLLPNVTDNIISRLIKLSYRIESTPFDLAPFELLASLILSNVTDIKVWKSLLQLLDTVESI